MLVAACGGSGGESGSASVTVVTAATPAPAAVASPTPSPSPTAAPTPAPSPVAVAVPAAPPVPASWAAGAAALFDVAPDVPGCKAGTLKASVKADVLVRLNAIRALHGLAPVTYSAADDEQTAQSSLMMAANGALSHTPPPTWKCHTASGATGAGTSNLYGGTVSPFLRWYTDDDYLGGWLIEIGSASLGHRRWMLDPFMGKVSYGRVSQVLADGSRTDSASLKVFDFAGGVAAPGGVPPFVAYPYGDYPARYMDPAAFLSFSVVAGTTGRSASSGVRFGNATVAVSANGQALAVSSVSHDNEGFGIPNVIQWKVAGLQSGVTYTVRISGITGAPVGEYSYQFRLVN